MIPRFGLGLLATLGLFTATIRADIVTVTVTGVVDYSVILGNQTSVQDGAPVSMSFTVDSNNFANSASFPTRGYQIDLSSWNMLVDGQPVPIVNPQPSGTAYFVLRNNDPAVDGFFLSPGLDLPFPLAVTIPGLAPQHDLDFNLGFNNGNVLTSLNILDALGTYNLTGIGSYLWTIGRLGNPGAEYAFESLTLSAVPEPGSLALLGTSICGFAAWRTRRRAARRQISSN